MVLPQPSWRAQHDGAGGRRKGAIGPRDRLSDEHRFRPSGNLVVSNLVRWGLKAIGLASTFRAREGGNGEQGTSGSLIWLKGVAMDSSSSNSVGPFGVSTHVSPSGEPDKDGPRVRANSVGAVQGALSSAADFNSISLTYSKPMFFGRLDHERL